LTTTRQSIKQLHNNEIVTIAGDCRVVRRLPDTSQWHIILLYLTHI